MGREETQLERWKCWQAALQGLVRGFSYPDSDWVKSLISGTWLEAFGGPLERLGISVKVLEKSLAKLPKAEEEALQELQIEYTYLFINALPRVPAPPYASAYYDQGFLMGEAAERAKKTYCHFGLDLADDFYDLPDHIAVEIAFIAELMARLIAAQEQGAKEQVHILKKEIENFLSEQLRPWLPEFCKRVQETARLPFYGGVVELTKEVLDYFPELNEK